MPRHSDASTLPSSSSSATARASSAPPAAAAAAARTPVSAQAPASARGGPRRQSLSEEEEAKVYKLLESCLGAEYMRCRAEGYDDDLDDMSEGLYDDDEDDDPFGIKKRRIQRQKSKEQVRKVEQQTPVKKRSSLDDIPSFI